MSTKHAPEIADRWGMSMIDSRARTLKEFLAQQERQPHVDDFQSVCSDLSRRRIEAI